MATAAGNILLTLQTRATQGGFTDLVSFGQILGQVANALKEVIDDGINFSRAFRALPGDITEADKATKGLVDTYTLMQQRNKLAAAGLVVTGEEFAKLTKFAAATAQTMGMEVEPAVNSFMNSLTSGRTTALKKFGIDLAETGSTAETLSGVLAEVTGRVDDMSVKMRDSKDHFFRFKNNIGTASGALVTMAGSIGIVDTALNSLNETLEAFNTELLTSEGLGANVGDFFLSMVEDILRGVRAASRFLNSNETIKKVLLAAAPFLGPLGVPIASLILGKEGIEALYREFNEIASAQRLKAFQSAEGVRQHEVQAQAQALAEQLADEFVGPQVPAGFAGPGKKKSKGKGGKALLSAEEDFGFVIDPETGETVSREFLSVQKKLQEMMAQEMSKNDLRVVTLEEQKKLDDIRLESQGQLNDKLWQEELEQADREKQLALEHEQWLLANSEEFAAEHRRIEQEKFHARIMDASSAFGDLSALQDVENKKAFNVGKAAALASASLAGGVAVSQAYARGLEVPFVGWLLGPIYAGFAGIQAAVNIARIAKLQYKGGGKVSGVETGAGAAPSTGAAPELGTGAGAGSGERGPQIINVQLGADTLMSALINESKDRDRGGFETILLKAGA
jgi:hypothetical protein